MIQTESMLQIISYLQSFPCKLLEVLIVEFNQSFTPFSFLFVRGEHHEYAAGEQFVIQQNRAWAQSSLTILMKVVDKSYYGFIAIGLSACRQRNRRHVFFDEPDDWRTSRLGNTS